MREEVVEGAVLVVVDDTVELVLMLMGEREKSEERSEGEGRREVGVKRGAQARGCRRLTLRTY